MDVVWSWTTTWTNGVRFHECDKRAITCDVEIAQYENETIKCEKKVNEPPNVTKELSHVMLKLHNMRIESLNVKFW